MSSAWKWSCSRLLTTRQVRAFLMVVGRFVVARPSPTPPLPAVVALAEYYITSESVFLLMQALSGGELYDALQQQPNGRFGEEHASYLVRQMVSSVAYLHSVGIVHRDLKLENWICELPVGELDAVATESATRSSTVVTLTFHRCSPPSIFSPSPSQLVRRPSAICGS